jgi:hypothetical protein
MIIKKENFISIGRWLCFGILFIFGTDITPDYYQLAVDVCEDSNISRYCHIIEKSALGKDTTEVCNTLQLYLNESITFTKQCIMIFANTNRYRNTRPYVIYLMAYNIWLASLPLAVFDTILNILDSNRLQEWLINNHLQRLKKIYPHGQTIADVSVLLLIVLIILCVIQMFCNYNIIMNKTTMQMREFASTTCKYYFGNECTTIGHTIYTNNAPKTSCATFGYINNWTATQTATCETIFVPTRMTNVDIWLLDYNSPFLTIYALFTIFMDIRLYLRHIKSKVDNVTSQPKDVA